MATSVQVNKMYLVLEYMKMGDLVNVLKARGAEAGANTHSADGAAAPAEGAFTPLSDLEVWNIFRQVVSGIRYLHYQNVVHGDIKPQVSPLLHQLRSFGPVLIRCYSYWVRIYCWARTAS